MKYIITLFSSLFLIGNALAWCDETTIQSINGGGEIIITTDGDIYRVSLMDKSTAALWLPGDDILVCDDDEIINKDEGEKIYVEKVE